MKDRREEAKRHKRMAKLERKHDRRDVTAPARGQETPLPGPNQRMGTVLTIPAMRQILRNM